MRGKDISVVICTRDRPEMLRVCLRSLAKSAEHPAEVVVVDQSADGKTGQVVQDVSVAFPIRYLKLESAGIAIARNAGAKASQAKIVAFTDDDCIADPEWVGALAREFDQPDTSCVCGHTYPANHTDRPREAYIATLNHRLHDRVEGKRNPVMIGRGNNMAFRREFLLKLGGFNEGIGVGTRLFAGDDLDVFYRLLQAGGTIAHTPDAVVLHAQPDDWREVVKKKRGYAISAAAILASRARDGDMYAGLLLIGKMMYEFGYLLCGGIIRFNGRLAAVGWHSFMGTLSGLKYARNPAFTSELRELYRQARNSSNR